MALTDSDGNLIETYEYDVFGAPTTTHSGDTNNRFLFAGCDYDTATGLYNLPGVDYLPYLGRALQGGTYYDEPATTAPTQPKKEEPSVKEQKPDPEDKLPISNFKEDCEKNGILVLTLTLNLKLLYDTSNLSDADKAEYNKDPASYVQFGEWIKQASIVFNKCCIELKQGTATTGPAASPTTEDQMRKLINDNKANAKNTTTVVVPELPGHGFLAGKAIKGESGAVIARHAMILAHELGHAYASFDDDESKDSTNFMVKDPGFRYCVDVTRDQCKALRKGMK